MHTLIQITLSLALATMMFELLLRFGPVSGGRASAVYDADVGYWHKRNFASWHNRSCYRTAYAFGEHGELLPIVAYDEARPDIVVLGNSYIEGLMNRHENRLHNALSTALGGTYDVYNFALYGTNIGHQYLIYRHKVPAGSNEKLVLHFVNIPTAAAPSDGEVGALRRQLVEGVFDDAGTFRATVYRDYNGLERLRDLIGHTEYYEFVLTSAGVVGEWFGESVPAEDELDVGAEAEADPYDAIAPDRARHLRNLFGAFQAIAAERGSRYVPVVYSGSEFVPSHYKPALLALFRDIGVEVIDLDELMGTSGIAHFGFECDYHWSDETHRTVGALLASELRRAGLATPGPGVRGAAEN